MNIARIVAHIIFQLGLFINAVLFLPQAVKVFKMKKATGLSLTTFVGFNLLQFLTFLHGYYHHDIELMIGIGLSLITCGAVTVGIIRFRKTG